MKKLLAIILAVITATSVFAVNASALWGVEDEEIFINPIFSLDNILYYLDDETFEATVVDFETDDEGKPTLAPEVVIPETVTRDGTHYTVTAIGYAAFADCGTIKEVTIPATVSSIDEVAFSGTSNLEKVIIPDECYFEYFGDNVFQYSPAPLYFEENAVDGEVILGQNVLYSYIGSEESYTVPKEITILASYAFFMSDVKEITLNENIFDVGDYTFSSCMNLEKINGTEALQYIGAGAFAFCPNLTEVKLGDSLEYINFGAFEGTPIKELRLGASVYNVTGAFYGCKTLEKITVSEENPNYFVEDDVLYYDFGADEEGGQSYNAVEYFIITSDKTSFTAKANTVFIYGYAFYNCKQLKTVDFSACEYLDIGECAFANCTFESFDFSKVDIISVGAFRGCKNLKAADLSSTSYIDSSAFENCTSLASVTFGDNLGGVGSRAFASTAIETVSLGGDDSYIEESAFANCKKLKRVDFKDGVDCIESYMFTGCTALERVYIADSVTYIDDAFTGCENVTFEVLKYSYACDYVEENGLNYEIVGKVPFFTRVERFFAKIFDFLFGWMFW